jgi:predicted GNAT family acetyltransferase
MAAFGIALPSLSLALQRCGGRMFPLGWAYLLRAIRKNDRLDLCLVGVRPDLMNRGVNALLMDATSREIIRHGIKVVESNPELETNTKVQSQWKFYEHRQHRRRRCYIRRIAPEPAGSDTAN